MKQGNNKMGRGGGEDQKNQSVSCPILFGACCSVQEEETLET